MSLIHFHIFLISVSILFGIGFGFWEIAHSAGSKCMIDCWTGIASFAAAAVLAAYLTWFCCRLKKKSAGHGLILRSPI